MIYLKDFSFYAFFFSFIDEMVEEFDIESKNLMLNFKLR